MGKYLVVYVGNSIGVPTIGNVRVDVGYDIYTEDGIRKVEKDICASGSLSGCTVVNIIPLNG